MTKLKLFLGFMAISGLCSAMEEGSDPELLLPDMENGSSFLAAADYRGTELNERWLDRMLAVVAPKPEPEKIYGLFKGGGSGYILTTRGNTSMFETDPKVREFFIQEDHQGALRVRQERRAEVKGVTKDYFVGKGYGYHKETGELGWFDEGELVSYPKHLRAFIQADQVKNGYKKKLTNINPDQEEAEGYNKFTGEFGTHAKAMILTDLKEIEAIEKANQIKEQYVKERLNKEQAKELLEKIASYISQQVEVTMADLTYVTENSVTILTSLEKTTAVGVKALILSKSIEGDEEKLEKYVREHHPRADEDFKLITESPKRADNSYFTDIALQEKVREAAERHCKYVIAGMKEFGIPNPLEKQSS